MSVGTASIFYCDNKSLLESIPRSTVDLIYIDPPYNTGKQQSSHGMSFEDSWESIDDYLGFISVRLRLAKRVLKSSGSIFVHLDYHTVWDVKPIMDTIFGRQNYINDIIWAYDYGGRSKTRWSRKHDVILYYVRDSKNYCFNYDSIDRIPYMAPDLVGDEKAKRGKTPTDVWWQTIVPTMGKERTGYPTQKPLPILERIVCVHSRPGDIILDFFAGSGTTGEACLRLGRNAILCDENEDAISIMRRRFKPYRGVTFYRSPHSISNILGGR